MGGNKTPEKRRCCWLLSLLLPWKLYHFIIYDCRPDTVNSKTRAPEWRKLQSQWRWAHACLCYLGPPSFILYRIRAPLLVNLALATLAALDSQTQCLGGITSHLADDVSLAWHMLSFVLALMLLAFRVNRVYLRWANALQAFGGIGNHAVTLAQQAVLWVPDARLQAELLRWSATWQFSVHQLVTRADALHPKVACLLTEAESAAYHAAPKPRQLVVQQLRQLVSRARLETGKFLAMNETLTKGSNDMGVCGRSFFYAMPYALSLTCTGFLEIWLLLLPLAAAVDSKSAAAASTSEGRLHHSLAAMMPGAIVLNVVWDVLMHALACILTLGLDEVTNQLEQPFAHIPTLDMADATLRAVDRAVAETTTMAALTDRRLLGPADGENCGDAGTNGSLAIRVTVS